MSSSILKAIQFNNIDLIKEFIYSGYDFNIKSDTFGVCALHFAAGLGFVEITQLLINENVNLNQQATLTGFTPLHASCSFNRSLTFQLLLYSGADLSIKCHKNETPLDLAIKDNNKEIIQIIDNYHTYKILKNSMSYHEFNTKKIKL